MPELDRSASQHEQNIVLASLLMGGSQREESADPPQRFAARRRLYLTNPGQPRVIESDVIHIHGWVTTAPTLYDTPRRNISLSPRSDASGLFSFRKAVPKLQSSSSLEQTRLESALRTSLDAVPLEDGTSHPAEEVIAKALKSGKCQSVLEWLRVFSLNIAQPDFAASILRCLGRQNAPGTSLWRANLVRDGLAMKDVEIRDAAVQAAELWEDPSLVDVLESHSEPVSWLQHYIFEVIDDLQR